MKILVVEDDEFVAQALTAVLNNQNYAVEVASDGQAAWELVQAFDYDLILLDVMLPKLDGISLCRQIRSKGLQTPILLLTGRDSSHEKAVGLDAGADDYLIKPFDSEELVARVRALLRRGGLAAQPVLEWGDLQLDPSNCQVTYAQKQLPLTPKEYALLELFLRNSRRVFSCGMILEHLWSYEDTPGEEAVRTHIKGLRQKLKAAGGKSDLIETVYGIGYRLKPLEEQKRAGEAGGENQKSKIKNQKSKQQTLTAVAGVWQKFKARITQQVQVLEQAAQALDTNALEQELLASAQKEAHSLAGALGTFGFPSGSKLAKKIENLLRADRILEPDEVRDFQHSVVQLRQEIQQQPAADKTKANDERPLLLVVDSERLQAQQLTEAAAHWGLRVAIATDLNTARNKLYQEHPDVVLLDPNVSPHFEDSLSLLTQLGQRKPPVPVLVFTEQTDLNNRLQVARNGGYTFLQKPMPAAEVLNAVMQALEHAPHAEAHVLAVDDDPNILAVLHTLLTPWGLKVTTLDDPRRFWETLEATAPDLLILDVEMPHVNGIELCQVVRNDPRWSELPILFLTVHSDANIVNQVFSVGADDFVNKPIVGPELVTRIINRLERIKLRRRMSQTQQRLEHGKDAQSIAALRESEERLRCTLEAAKIGIWDWNLTTNKIIWSVGHERLFGFAPGTFDGTYETFIACILPEDREYLTIALNRASTEKLDFSHEFRVVWQDGSIHWIEGRGRFFDDETGKPVRMLGTVRNISDRKQAETDLHAAKNELELRVAERTAELVRTNEQLQSELGERQKTQAALYNSQALFAGIVEIADDAIISIDSNQRITLFNQGAEKIFGYSAAQVLGEPLDLLLPQRFTQAHRQHVAEFGHSPNQARRMGERREIYGCRQDGSEFPAEATISKLNLGGETIYTVYLRDVSDRKQIERLKDEFVSVVSHELRTPLTSIHGSLGMLASGLLQTHSEQGKRLLQIAADSTKRLVRLIEDILDIERIESGKVKMEKESCNVADLIEEAVNVMQLLADKAKITITVSSLPFRLYADRDRIVQTLTNLLSNAIKFSPAGSTVWLSAEIVAISGEWVETLHATSFLASGKAGFSPPATNTQQILFKVKDEGRGIPADKLDSIFERFQQVDSTDSRKHDGTGLGLAICRSIVQQHGGRIWVESVLGEGSTFYFTLPIQTTSRVDSKDFSTDPAPLARKDVACSRDVACNVSTHSPLVLVCDDDPAVGNQLQTLLESRGYRVVIVNSGEEAIALATALHPDAILLDLLMPGMNGWEVMALLKERADTKNIPIVICSIYTPPKSNSLSQDFVDWVSKPLDENSLFQSLKQALAKTQKRVRVLLVEDDRELAEVLGTLLESHEIETFLAKNGREAIHLCQEIKPDLLILDIILPEVDGFAVVDWLHQHNQLYSTPLVVYSAKDLDDSECNRLKLGHTEFLTKGRVTPQEFEQRVTQLIGQITRSKQDSSSNDNKENSGG